MFNPENCIEIVTGELHDVPESAKFKLLGEQEMLVYFVEDETDFLVERGIRIEIDVPPGRILVKSKGRVWLTPQVSVQHAERTSSEVFTSLDRPEPLSPEMQAIKRMQRQNEIEREKLYSRLETAQIERERKNQDVIDQQNSKPTVSDERKTGSSVPDSKTAPKSAAPDKSGRRDGDVGKSVGNDDGAQDEVGDADE